MKGFKLTTINKQEPTYRQPSTGKIIEGIAAGAFIQGLIVLPPAIASLSIMNKLSEEGKDEFKAVDKAVAETLKATGLEEKGVKVIKASKENMGSITKILTECFDKSIPIRFMPKVIKDFYVKIYKDLLEKGVNAFYSPLHKKVVIPEKKLCLAPFHEIGHAANHNLSTLCNTLQKTRILSKLVLPITLVAYFKTTKAKGEKPKSKTDKATTFIKDNAGKLVFLALVPMLIEEKIASIKGNSYAKRFLSPKVAKQVSKTNSLAYLTYLSYSILMSVGLALGIKVKDSIAKPKKIKIKKHSQVAQQ